MPPGRSPSTARVLEGARARRAQALAQGIQIGARVDVEQQRRGTLQAHARPGVTGQGAVALAAVGPKARDDRVRRGEQQPVGAGAVTIGHDHHLRARIRRGARRQERLQLGWIERGAVSRNAQHALHALGGGACRPPT